MSKFFMMIGIAGSGKSTWAKNNLNKEGMFEEIYSSDEYRKNLFGNINDQTHNDVLFQTIHKDIIKALKSGKNICYDATNLTIKNRKVILDLIKNNHIKCEKIAVLMEVEFPMILKQNSEREKKVPENVLYQMLNKFEIPFINEGFDRIETVFRQENEPLNIFKVYDLMKNFDQNNPNHSKDLFNHCFECYKNIDRTDGNLELIIASSIHDFGKLYTQTIDKEKKYAHYIGHENCGAYLSLFLDYDKLNINKEKIAFYINYHMIPYKLKNAKENTLNKYICLFNEEWNNIINLHEADVNAH